MQTVRETNAASQKEQKGLTQEVRQHSTQIFDINRRIEIVVETSGIRHTELSEEFNKFRKKQTSTRIELSGSNIQSRRRSAGYFPSQVQISNSKESFKNN